MRKLIYLPVLLILTSVLFWRCSEKDSPVLTRIASMVSDSPKVALAALGELGDSALSEADRHYRDLLLIKARDKAYVTHTSDSLILDCLGYYGKHKDSPHYPEALYYGGRVYSDLGDYPTALRYFQAALDEYDRHEYDLELKSRILSQTGRLLNSLRIHRQAVPYLRETLGLDSVLKDTFALAYNHLLLGDIFEKLGDYDEAEIAFRKAYDWGMLISPVEAANARIYLASVKLHKGNVDSALDIIRGIGGEVIPEFRNLYLAIGSEVYYRAGIFDTAYIYAHELVLSPDLNNRKTGCRMILMPELRRYVPADSVGILHDMYKSTVDAYVDSHEGEQVVVQNSMYNYSIHERERARAEEEKQRADRILFIMLVMLLVGLSGFFIHVYVSKRRIIRMQRGLCYLLELKSNYITAWDGGCLYIEGGKVKEIEINEVKPLENEVKLPEKEMLLLPAPDNVGSLRKRLLKELGEINGQLRSEPIAPKGYFQSDVCETVQKYLKEERMIADGKPLWGDIERIVLGESKNFKTNLMMLSDGKVNDSDYKMALLLRCGLGITDISVLMGRVKSAITKRRKQLGRKLFGEEFDTKSLVCIIRLL